MPRRQSRKMYLAKLLICTTQNVQKLPRHQIHLKDYDTEEWNALNSRFITIHFHGYLLLNAFHNECIGI